MEKKQMLTGIFLIPTLHVSTSRDANAAVKAIVHQLGALNCEPDNRAAVVKYTGLLSKKQKKYLTEKQKTMVTILHTLKPSMKHHLQIVIHFIFQRMKK